MQSQLKSINVMSHKLRAKYTCDAVDPINDGGAEQVKLSAVYSDGDPENNQFNEATPWGTLEMGVDNPAAKGFFKPGESYYLDFTPVGNAGDAIETATA
jgi:hypothetical protein